MHCNSDSFNIAPEDLVAVLNMVEELELEVTGSGLSFEQVMAILKGVVEGGIKVKRRRLTTTWYTKMRLDGELVRQAEKKIGKFYCLGGNNLEK